MAIILSNLEALCFDIKHSKFLPFKNNWNNSYINSMYTSFLLLPLPISNSSYVITYSLSNSRLLQLSMYIHPYGCVRVHVRVCVCVYTRNLIRCCSCILPRAELWVWMIYQGTYHCRRNNHPLAEAINFL